MWNPTKLVIIFFPVIKRLFKQFTEFIGAFDLLIDLADQMNIIAKNLDLFAFEYFTIHLNKLKQRQK